MLKTSKNFELSTLQLENEQKVQEIEKLRSKLEISENQVSLLNSKLINEETKVKELIGEKLNETQKVDENLLVASKWKNFYNLEKLKKDQAIKKLDEMVKLMVNKGMTVSSPSLNTHDTKAIKKLQMELRNEKIKYEKLLSEKQQLIHDHCNQIQNIEKNLQIIKDERDNLKIFANAKKLEKTSDNTSLNVSTYNTVGSNQKLPNITIDNVQNNNLIINSNELSIRPVSPLRTHCEGVVSLVPYNKTKRGGRKLSWKKYYAVLTINEFAIFADKIDKNIPKPFQKIEIKNIKSVFKIAHNDLLKAEFKDIPKIFMIRYFDEDIANVAGIVQQMNDDIDTMESLDSNQKFIQKYKGHLLYVNKVDNQPFCGACSLNLGENMQGNKLSFCYECKKCALQFHSYHITNNDPAVSYCSDDSPNNDETQSENSNFYMNMFIMTPSIEDQSKWIYNFNRILKFSKNINSKSVTNNEDSNSSLSRKASKLYFLFYYLYF